MLDACLYLSPDRLNLLHQKDGDRGEMEEMKVMLWKEGDIPLKDPEVQEHDSSHSPRRTALHPYFLPCLESSSLPHLITPPLICYVTSNLIACDRAKSKEISGSVVWNRASVTPEVGT